MIVVQNNGSELFGIPKDLLGFWADWDVCEAVRSDITLDDDRLKDIEGLFLGFESGDRDEWAKILPTLENIKYLVSWTGNNTQKLFDAICNMTWLQRLCFGRLSARSLSSIEYLNKLEYLCAFQLVGKKDLSPLMSLPSLRVLELGINPAVIDFSCFEQNQLRSVRTIKLSSNKTVVVPTIRHFAQIPSLQYLSIPQVRAEDKDLSSLLTLKNLRVVHLAQRGWPKSEIEILSQYGMEVRLGLPKS